VLVIDDHEGTRNTYSRFLVRAGYETATAATGRVGVDLALARAFDVHPKKGSLAPFFGRSKELISFLQLTPEKARQRRRRSQGSFARTFAVSSRSVLSVPKVQLSVGLGYPPSAGVLGIPRVLINANRKLR
jgi:hypothetical protein